MNNRGFTLVEMLVSVAIFSIVMIIALGSLLAMSESDRKAQTLKSVINNLNFSLDSMSRTIRTGTIYHCGGSSVVPLSQVYDCTGIGGSPAPSDSFSFRNVEGQTVTYQLSVDSGLCAQPSGAVGCIARSINGSALSPITSSEVVISTLLFYVTGAEVAGTQPKVAMLLSGSVKVGGTQESKFNLQSSVTQRIYDQ